MSAFTNIDQFQVSGFSDLDADTVSDFTDIGEFGVEITTIGYGEGGFGEGPYGGYSIRTLNASFTRWTDIETP